MAPGREEAGRRSGSGIRPESRAPDGRHRGWPAGDRSGPARLWSGRQSFDAVRPAEHFYRHAIRFDELFTRLVFPLRETRSLRLEADHVEETATEYRRHLYEFDDVDVIVLEGIYLLKRAFQRRYDLSIWLRCSFATALDRAVARAQEGLRGDGMCRRGLTGGGPAGCRRRE